MKRAFNYATILMVLSVFLVPWANAADLSADYLDGRWVIDEQNCSCRIQSTLNLTKMARLKALGPAKLKSSDSGGLKKASWTFTW